MDTYVRKLRMRRELGSNQPPNVGNGQDFDCSEYSFDWLDSIDIEFKAIKLLHLLNGN